jgi:tetratricopeptide (TPR) repeat protein
LFVLAACDADRGGAVPSGSSQSAAEKRPSYERELEALNAGIETAIRLSAKTPDDGLLPLEAISLHVERATLTGDYEDYKRAESLLALQESRPSRPGHTCLVEAKLHFALHRLQRAGRALDACPTTVERIEVAVLRGDIDFYSGRYAEAEKLYRALVNQVGLPGHYVRLARLRNKMGSPGEAAAFVEAAEKRYHGGSATMKAWLKLQRGLIAWERGRIDEALALYNAAAGELPGWWLIDEQIAEAKRLSGDTAGARALFESIIGRGSRPEHMDELARLLREGKTPDAATEWIRRAAAIHRERLESLPEASVGHAVEHFLQFGAPAEASELARRNAELRPFGEAQIALAAALFRSGQAGAAAELIARVERSGWDTAQLHAIAAQIYAGLGRRADADAQRARAVAMNPYAMRLYPLAQPIQPDTVSML